MPREKHLIEPQELFSDLHNIPDSIEPSGSRALREAFAVVEAKLSHLRDQDPAEVDSGEIYKVSNSLSGLIRSGVEMSKWAHARDELFGRHLDHIQEYLLMAFRENPQVCRTIKAVLARLDVGHD